MSSPFKFVLGVAMMLSLPAAAFERPDPWITAKAKVALLVDTSVHSRAIHVDTFDGKVTLFGYVYDRAEREQAERVAKQIEGVREVVNLLRVSERPAMKAAKRTDDALEREVKKALSADPALADEKLTVESVSAGVVSINGEVPTTLAHLAALERISTVAGVKGVISRVHEENKPSDIEAWDLYLPTTKAAREIADRQLRDTRISAQVRSRMLADPIIPAIDVQIDTRAGIVSLNGVVDSVSAKERAETLAMATPGVSSVDNGLQVVAAEKRPMPALSDEAIKNSVDALLASRRLSRFEVTVESGVVSLSGPVTMSTERLRAAMLARTVQGVKAVQQRF